MYCTGCGSTIDDSLSLNYCSRCGNAVPKRESASVSENLAQSVTYVGGLGLAGSIFLTVFMIRRAVPVEAIIPLVVVYLATLFGICWLMLSYSYKMSGRKMRPQKNEESSFPVRLNARTTAQLKAQHEPTVSVVEHTTRTLDKTPIAR